MLTRNLDLFPNITWEETITRNLGISYAFFKSKFSKLYVLRTYSWIFLVRWLHIGVSMFDPTRKHDMGFFGLGLNLNEFGS